MRRAAEPYLVDRPRAKRVTDDELVWHVVEAMWPLVDIYSGASEQSLAYARRGQVAVYATRFVDSEICNGGFHQLFYNSTGILYAEAVAGFERLGAAEYAQLLQTAGALLGRSVPRDRDARIARLERIPYEEWKQRIAKAEARYYRIRRGTKALERFARRYIDEHPGEFFIGE